MAEVVFQNLEDMLPELEELESEGVFTRDELRIIIKRRTDFEYKLQKRIMEKQDVLKYLEYEMKLDLLRKKRSKKLKLRPYNTASLAMNRKIHTLFRKGLMKFPDDLQLWMQYIEFCKKTGSPRAIGLAFGKLLQQHANNPDMWLMAAKHEMEDMNNIENARLLFQKALRNNKESAQLWHEYFRLELLHVEKIKKRKKILLDGGIELNNEEEPEPEKIEDFLLNKTAEIVYNNAIQKITNDTDFRLKFLTICEEFEETDLLEDLIYNSLDKDFPDNEAVYEALSVRPITQLKNKQFIISDNDWKTVEGEVERKFEEVLEKRKTSVMYEKYLNCFANLIKDSNSPEQIQRRLKLVTGILEKGEKDKCVTESMYIFWSELLMQIGEESKALGCLETALKSHSKSPTIWQSYLFLKMENVDDWKSMVVEFKRCFSSLQGNSVSIWKLYIDAAITVSVEETKLTFEEALKSHREVRDTYSPQYLNWIYETEGISSARTLYRKHLDGVFDKHFLETCMDIENLQEKKKLKNLRLLHEKAVAEFGEKCYDVWLSYIQFEKENAPEDFDRIGILYRKAVKTLEGKLNAEFITEYSLM